MEAKKLKRRGYRIVSGYICSFLFCLVITAYESPGQQIQKWEGSIETIGGVRFIKNPEEPRFGDIEFLRRRKRYPLGLFAIAQGGIQDFYFKLFFRHLNAFSINQ